MRVCHCALPYTSPLGHKVCENCSNNWEQDNTYQGTYTIDFSPIYICKKCGNNDLNKIRMEYLKEEDILLVKCKLCGYEWKENTYDKKGEHSRKELEKLLKEYEEE